MTSKLTVDDMFDGTSMISNTTLKLNFVDSSLYQRRWVEIEEGGYAISNTQRPVYEVAYLENPVESCKKWFQSFGYGSDWTVVAQCKNDQLEWKYLISKERKGYWTL